MFNQIQLIGRVGKDPETFTTKNGKLVKFSFAVSEKFKREGEQVEETEWFTVIVSERSAETCEKYVQKGDLLFVQGKFRSRKYEDKEGVTRTILEVRNATFQMLGSKKKEGTTPETSGPIEATPVIHDGQPVDDLPF